MIKRIRYLITVRCTTIFELKYNWLTFLQLAKDPKAFAEKMKAIWKHLSEDEPENQMPPKNVEQLIEMLSREGARRFVHVTNFIAENIYMAPTYAKKTFTFALHEFAVLADKFIKVCLEIITPTNYSVDEPNRT